MGKFNFIKTEIEGVYIIENTRFTDERGYFMETYNEEEFKNNGIDVTFMQDNESSSTKGVLRGMHFQSQFPQGKLVRVQYGEVFDVALDIRKNSKTFGKWVGAYLNHKNNRQLYIPEGFAHGFVVLSDRAKFVYKCTNLYHPEFENGIKWDDKEINILWPIQSIEKIILSKKDQNLQSFKEYKKSSINN